MQNLGLFRQQRHQVPRRGVAGIAAGHEHGIDARQLTEHFAPFAQRGFHRSRIAVIGVHRGIPDPDIQAVGVEQARKLDHHAHGRQREVRAVGGIVGARRDQLDGIAAKDRKVADVLLEDGDGPSVIRIRFRTVAQLVAAQRVARRARFREAIGKSDGTAGNAQFAQESADTEQDAARVVAGDRYGVRGGVNAVAFGRAGGARDFDGDRGAGRCGLPPDPGALLDFFDQQRDGLGFAWGQFRRRYDRRFGQIQCGGGRHYGGD